MRLRRAFFDWYVPRTLCRQLLPFTEMLSRSFIKAKPSSSINALRAHRTHREVIIQPPSLSQTTQSTFMSTNFDRDSNNSEKPSSRNPGLPKINLKDLGATTPIRIVIYIVIGIIGTAETVFWCQWLWRFIYPASKDARKEEGSEVEKT